MSNPHNLTPEELDALFHPEIPDDFDYEAPLWSEILPGLFQGGTYDLDIIGDPDAIEHNDPRYTPVITTKDFDTVVTLYQWAHPADWFVRELRYPFYDKDVNHFPFQELFDIVKLAHADWKRNKRVLVRCQAGLNRSGLITALILIREGYNAVEAIRMQREARSNWVLFREEFVEFLLNLDPELWRGDTYGAPSAEQAA
jgi:protein-tyrosine phosphatase